MSLNLPLRFKQTLEAQGRDTSIIPLVVIDNIWYISTNHVTVDGKKFDPLLLNMPSLKESIDFEKRKYRISNVSLNVSNTPYNGERLSEKISSQYYSNIINANCRIYWACESTTTIDKGEDTDALLVYQGIIRRYTHDDKVVKIVAEDRSQSKLHINLPAEKILDTNIEKQENRYIPMVFGEVLKSPLVLKRNMPEFNQGADFNENNAEVDFYADYNQGSQFRSLALEGFGDALYPILVKVGNKLAFIPERVATHDSILDQLNQAVESSEVEEQSIDDEDISPTYPYVGIEFNQILFYISGAGNKVTMGANSKSPILKNLMYAYIKTELEKKMVKVLAGGETDYFVVSGDMQHNNEHSIYTGMQLNETDIIEVFGTIYGESNSTANFYTGESQLHGIDSDQTGYKYDQNGDDEEAKLQEERGAKQEGVLGFQIVPDLISRSDTLSSAALLTKGNISVGFANARKAINSDQDKLVSIRIGGNQAGDKHKVQLSINLSDLDEDKFTEYNSFNNNLDDVVIQNSDALMYYLKFEKAALAEATMAARVRIQDSSITQHFIVDKADQLDYFGNIDGRTNSASLPEVIKNIAEEELGQEVLDINTSEYMNNDWEYRHWRYDFTVKDKINSKKLIEQLTSASPYISRFNYLGEFRFNAIKRNPTTHDHMIYKHDVIDFSYDRTKIEDVHTKVIINYNWSYPYEKFNSQAEFKYALTNIASVDIAKAYGYYGFSYSENYEADSVAGKVTDTTLVIDDDRGKYISDFNTARNYAEWLFEYSRNQKLIVNLKLPVGKYLNIEVGDIVRFDSLLSHSKPYGINYATNDNLNQQVTTPYFMILSTDKKIDHINIKCQQQHVLQDYENIDVHGCMDENSCNYNSEATIEDYSCYYPETVCKDCNGACLPEFEDLDGDGLCDCPEEDEATDCYSNLVDECGCMELDENDAPIPNPLFTDTCGNTHNPDTNEPYCTSQAAENASLEFGCMDSGAVNYNPNAHCNPSGENNTLCLMPINRDPLVDVEDGSENWDEWDIEMAICPVHTMDGLDVENYWKDLMPEKNFDLAENENYSPTDLEIGVGIWDGTDWDGAPPDTNSYGKTFATKGEQILYEIQFFCANNGDAMCESDVRDQAIEYWEDENYQALQYLNFPIILYSNYEQCLIESYARIDRIGLTLRSTEEVITTINDISVADAPNILKDLADDTSTEDDENQIQTAFNLGLIDIGDYDSIPYVIIKVYQKQSNGFEPIAEYGTEGNLRVHRGEETETLKNGDIYESEEPTYFNIQYSHTVDDTDNDYPEDGGVYMFNIKIYKSFPELTDNNFMHALSGNFFIDWQNQAAMDCIETGSIGLGDVNGDSTWDVLDIVTMANCVLNQNCSNLEFNKCIDVNGDGFYNVLDIVALANCILNQDCDNLGE